VRRIWFSLPAINAGVHSSIFFWLFMTLQFHNPDTVASLLDRQRQAFLADMNPSLAQRIDRLARLERLIDAKSGEEFAALIAEDFGGRSRVETAFTETIFIRTAIGHARRHLRSWMRPQRVKTALAHRPGRSCVIRQPLGVVGIISPWNYPLQLALAPLVGVLAAGNRALLKPSELTPRFSEALQARVAELFAEDEVAVMTGDTEFGKRFAALPFDHLVFTGSTSVGRLVAQAAARNLTPVTLELGGKSPAIIDASCDLELTARRLAFGKLLNAGQTCIAPDYVLAPREQVNEVAAALQDSMARLYPSIHDNPDYSSIISDRHYSRLRGLVEDARERGARVIDIHAERQPSALGLRKLSPKLLLDVNENMRVMQEEIFGPLLPIVPYDSHDEAIRYVNARDRPLALYWFGRDRARRHEVLSNTISGGATINDTLVHILQDNLPFGGVGASGQGHYHGEFGFRQFSKEKGVFIQSRFALTGMAYPPYTAVTDGVARLLSWLA
jgi:coniferyl-aldehyde dehydrogenase